MTSWVIRDNVTGYQFETYSKKNRDLAEESQRYTVIPIVKYLCDLNAKIKAEQQMKED